MSDGNVLTREQYYSFVPMTYLNLLDFVEQVIDGWQRKKAGTKEALRKRFLPHRVIISEDRTKALPLNAYGAPLGIDYNPEVDAYDYDTFQWVDIEDFDTLTGDFRFRQGSYDAENLSSSYYSFVQLYDENQVIPEKNKTSLKHYTSLIAQLQSILSGHYEINVYDEPKPSLATFE
jgi:hypothetical protein